MNIFGAVAVSHFDSLKCTKRSFLRLFSLCRPVGEKQRISTFTTLTDFKQQMHPLYLLYRHRQKQQQQSNEDVLGYMRALFSAFLQILTLLSTTKRRLKRVFPAALVSIRNVWLLSATTTATEFTFFLYFAPKVSEMPAHHFSHQLVPAFHVNEKRPTAPFRQLESGFLPRWPISARRGAGRLDKNRGRARDRSTAG